MCKMRNCMMCGLYQIFKLIKFWTSPIQMSKCVWVPVSGTFVKIP